MSALNNRRSIANDVYFTSVTDKKFKVNKVNVIFISKLSENAAVNAVIPRIISKCNEKFDTMAKLNRRLAELYETSINWSVRADADYQFCELSASVLADKFALDGEQILKEATKILIDCIFHPYLENGAFPAQSLELEKQNQIDDNDAEINDMTHYAYLKGYEEAFRGEPAEIRWGGTNEQVSAITSEDAMNAYRRIISEMRTEIICVGESDFDGIAEMFAEAFSGIERRPMGLPKALVSTPKKEVSRIDESLDIEQSKLVMFFKTPLRDKYKLLVMQMLYGGTETSKLFLNVRENMSLCYFCFSRLGFAKGFVSTECGVDRKNLEQTEKECLNQLSDIVKGDFTDDDIMHTKLDITNNLLTVRDTVGGIASHTLLCILFPENAFSIEEAVEEVNSVTREDIIEAAGSLTLDTVFVLSSKGGAENE